MYMIILVRILALQVLDKDFILTAPARNSPSDKHTLLSSQSVVIAVLQGPVLLSSCAMLEHCDGDWRKGAVGDCVRCKTRQSLGFTAVFHFGLPRELRTLPLPAFH